MKKITFLMISVIILLLIILLTFYIIDMKRMENNQPVVFSTWGYLYSPPVTENDNNVSFIATISEITNYDYCSAIVKPVNAENLGDAVSITIPQKLMSSCRVGTKVKITYNGLVMETYPSKIYVKDFEIYYDDLNNLPVEYGVETARQDNCFVITNSNNLYNKYMYDAFIENVNSNNDAFIRVIRFTIEGDTIITDIEYNGSSNKFYVTSDNRRDKFSSESDRKINTSEFDKLLTEEIEHGTITYLENLQTGDKIDIFYIANNAIID